MAGQSSEDVGKNNEYIAAQVVVSDERTRLENLAVEKRVSLTKYLYQYPGVVDTYFNLFKADILHLEEEASVLEYPVVIINRYGSICFRKGDMEVNFPCRYENPDDSRKPSFLETIIGDFFDSRFSPKCEKIMRDFDISDEKVCHTREEFVEYFKYRMVELKINKRNMWLGVKKKTSKQSILATLSLSPLAKYIHPSDPIMAMAYLRRCNTTSRQRKDKDQMKAYFNDQADIFRSIIDIEGLRISGYLESNRIVGKVELPMLDAHFDKIESGLLIPELNSLIGKGRTAKMVEKGCFSQFFLHRQYFRAAYSTVAKEMIFFEDSTIETRKAEVEKYPIDKRLVEDELEKYISGDTFISMSNLVRTGRSFHWGMDW